MAIHDLNIWGKKKKKETYRGTPSPTHCSSNMGVELDEIFSLGSAATVILEWWRWIPDISALVPALRDLCLQQQREDCNKGPCLKAG